MIKYTTFIILLALSILPLVDLVSPGLPITHDGQDHIARIANFYQNLEEGNIIPRWAGNLNWGYGHPILMFLYPLPSYMASFFHVLGFNFVDSTKIVFAVSFVLSGLSMYLFMKQIVGKYEALLSAVLYIYAPYRFVDLYVRGAIGEHVAFIFPPLVLYFIYKLSKEYKWYYSVGGALSIAGFILGHNAISLMFLPIFIAYTLYLLISQKNKKSLIIKVGSIFILGFGVASFFWIPAFFEGKYTLRDIVTKGGYLTRFVDFKDFLYGKWDYGGTGVFTVQIGIIQWVLTVTAIVLLFLKKTKHTILLGGLLLIFAASLFIMTPQAMPIWVVITTLQKFQFPWRFLSVSVFVTAMIAGLVVNSLPKKYALYVCVIGVVLTLFFTKDYWYAKEYKERDESFYTSIYKGTTDTGESAPIWSIRFMEKEPTSRIAVLEGEAQIFERQRTSTIHKYTIKAENSARIIENTLYFPGWHVYANGVEIPIQFQDQNHHGIITFTIPKGENSVDIIFKETKLRGISNMITLTTLVILCIYSILKGRIWQHFRLF